MKTEKSDNYSWEVQLTQPLNQIIDDFCRCWFSEDNLVRVERKKAMTKKLSSRKGNSSYGFAFANLNISEILNLNNITRLSKISKVSRLRKEGLPNTTDKQVIIDWYDSYLTDKAKEKAKTPTEVSRSLGITLNNLFFYKKKGMPEDLEEARAWIYNHKSKATLQSIGDAVGLTRERIRQLVKKGMPFNQSTTPIKDATLWLTERRKKRKSTPSTK